jgi:meckelin
MSSSTIIVLSEAILYLVYKLFYERFVEDKILNSIDLCSVSNVSVFILLYNHYGYYIHGRSPHGSTDVNMKDMIVNLERESKQMIGTRGLQDSSDDQIFIVRIGVEFRRQYQTLLQNYRVRMNKESSLLTSLDLSYQNRIRLQGNNRKDEHESDVLMASYRTLNEFLCSFINHSLINYNYVVLDRTFWEKVLNYEFRVGNPLETQGNVPNVLFVGQ